jgi:hypothetical protein
MKAVARRELLPLAAAFVLGCTPTAPAPNGSGRGTPPPTFSLSGRGVDSAGTAVPNAQVVIVSGDGTESSALTDGDGRYQVQGLPAGVVRVRASKDGYVTWTSTVEVPRTSPADFVLDFTGPSFDLAGSYTVTFTADAACTQLPEAARTRTYKASIAPELSPNRYFVSLSGARFYREGAFVASVAGHAGSFTTLPDGYQAVVHERLTDSTSIWIDFFARAPLDAPSVTVPMSAEYAYCADDDLTDAFRCRVPRLVCTSSKHTYTLTRH